MDQGRNVVIDDPLYVNRADPRLVTDLTSALPITKLLGFSGWNTAGNSLGLSLAEGASRYALLNTPAVVPTAVRYDATNAQAEYLLHRFVLDDTWKNVVQPAAYAQARSMGANPYNLTPDQVPVLQHFVQENLVPATRDFFDTYFKGRQLVYANGQDAPGTPPVHDATIASLDSVSVSLPWPRLFGTNFAPTTSLERGADTP